MTTNRAKKVIRENLLTIFTILGVVFGVIGGVALRSQHPDLTPIDDIPTGIKIPGDILLRGLHLVVIPLVITSLIIGLADNSKGRFNKQFGLTILYYLSTTIVAAILGLVVVSVIEPGKNSYNEGKKDNMAKSDLLSVIHDLIKNIIPDNIVGMTVQQTKTVVNNETHTVEEIKVDSINMLGIISVSMVLGIIVMKNKDECRPFLDFCVALNVIVNKLIKVVLWYSPIGIMFLVMSELAGHGVGKYASEMGMYIVTVLTGLAIHFFIVLPGALFGFTRRNPLVYYKSLIPAMATAFGTASSTVTIPVTMRCTERAGVRKEVIDFVIPVGATINMDGTALYEAVACLFIAQLNDVQLTNAQIVITALTATVAAIGAAGIPSAGLVTLVMVLNTVGLSTKHIAFILAVDWFLDRFRTMTNIVGDAVGCAIVEKIAGGEDRDFQELKEIELEDGSKRGQTNGVMIDLNVVGA